MARRHFRIGYLAAAFAAGLCFACALPGVAAEDDSGSSFLTPFPEGDVYQVTVFGDSFAEGILSGLVEAMGSDTRLNIQRKPHEFSGVMSTEFDAKAHDFEDSIGREPLNIAIVMIGEDDRVPLKSSTGRKVPIASPEWIAEYARRVDRMLVVPAEHGSQPRLW